ELGLEREAWERVRLRPFSRLSPRLANHLDAVMQGMKAAPMDVVRADLRAFLAVVAEELVEAQTPEVCPQGLPSRAAERFACFRSEVPAAGPVATLATETGL